ncbi:MAG: alpha-D-ribose 1-methylphosphonate 5-triphosphate diphosphatase [Pseudomonadota bacterium]
MQSWIIENGDILTPDGLDSGDLVVSDGYISSDPMADARRFSAEGHLVLPGIVDVHGDAFERVLFPRPHVSFDLELALHEVDRQLVSNGITTAFHGLSASWEPGLRSFEAAGVFMNVLERTRGDLACDMHVNLRWEVFCLDHPEDLQAWLRANHSILLSLNDHLTAYRGLQSDHRKIKRMAERTGLTPDGCVALIEKLWERADDVPSVVQKITKDAVGLGRMVFAHDEVSPDMRASHRKLGVSVSEFPMTLDTARSAIDADEAVILGAPNVLRGGTQNNAVDAEPAITAGLCTALASDYYYPAPLLAAFLLSARGGIGFPQAWQLVSSAPAQAAGLQDRGVLCTGRRADIVVVNPKTRLVRATFVAGRKVYERE